MGTNHFDCRGNTINSSGLSQFQIDLATIFFSLPESEGFLLAGGGALIAQGIVQRKTEDLDFFTSRNIGNVESACEAFTTAVTALGWTVTVIRSGEEFRRLQISGEEILIVDLAVDSPALKSPEITIAGP